jgi:hypothetical protein
VLIGAIIGGVVGLLLIVGLIVFFVAVTRRKKDNQSDDDVGAGHTLQSQSLPTDNYGPLPQSDQSHYESVHDRLD